MILSFLCTAHTEWNSFGWKWHEKALIRTNKFLCHIYYWCHVLWEICIIFSVPPIIWIFTDVHFDSYTENSMTHSLFRVVNLFYMIFFVVQFSLHWFFSASMRFFIRWTNFFFFTRNRNTTIKCVLTTKAMTTRKWRNVSPKRSNAAKTKLKSFYSVVRISHNSFILAQNFLYFRFTRRFQFVRVLLYVGLILLKENFVRLCSSV